MLLAPQTAHVAHPQARTGSKKGDFAESVREATGGIPIGFKISAQHLEDDIDTALRIGVDYLILDEAAQRLARFFNASVDLMKILARACGHTHLDQFELRDLTTWKRDVAYLTGVPYGGVTPL